MLFVRTDAPNGTTFSMDHPQDKEFQVCSNKDPVQIYIP